MFLENKFVKDRVIRSLSLLSEDNLDQFVSFYWMQINQSQ